VLDIRIALHLDLICFQTQTPTYSAGRKIVPHSIFNKGGNVTTIFAYRSRRYVIRNFLIFLKLVIGYEFIEQHVVYKTRSF
jgi:hypothetical protein